jgi:glycosyltransferase involved in cell wall biosynthesis
MKLFLAGPSFDPSFGGPAYSIPALGVALAERGITVGLWAADGTAASAIPPATAASSTLIPLHGKLQQAMAQFGTIDVLHDNGIWFPYNHAMARIAARQRIPRVVSLRGMLEPWALEQSRLKKQVAWQLYQRRDLRNADLLHATAPIEEINARALGLTGPYCVIANGIALPSRVARSAVRDGKRRTALFVSRIHPGKGIPLLLNAWATLRPQGWRLLIAGPDEDGHTAEIAALISTLSLEGEVRLCGPVYGEDKVGLYANADLFVLPTFSENFGIAVAEALAYGVPVLTTRGAPWESLETHDCGWWVEPDGPGILRGLRAAIDCSDETRREMGLRGAAMVAAQLNWDDIAMQFIEHYEALLKS